MAPPWKARISQPATFRGVPFRVDVSSFESGRRVVAHEYPLRDEPFIEDLGRRGRLFHVDGYVVGPDYLDQRDRLITALEAAGPGTLIHPYHGTRTVAVGDFHQTERKSEAGAAFFSVDFLETIARPFAPVATVAPADVVGASATSVLESSSNTFGLAYRVRLPAVTGVVARPLPSFTFASITDLVRSATATLYRTLSPIVRGTQQLAAFKRQIDTLHLEATSLVRTPFVLATRLGDVFRSIVSLPVLPRLGVTALLRAYTFASSSARPVATTATRAIERTNYDAAQRLVQTHVVAQASRYAAAAAATAAFESHEDAVMVRDAVVALIDEQAASAGDDGTYGALVQLRAEVLAAVPGEAQQFARLLPFTPRLTTPSLVVAYRLYGSTALEVDLVARNRIRHPGFVVGGRELQVLSRG